MLIIRLQRVGRKNDPSFRVVATDSHNAAKKSGRFLRVLGNYDPRRDYAQVEGEAIKDLMSKGAQLSPTVHNLLLKLKIIEGKKINVLPKKTVAKKEEPVVEAPVAETAPAPAEEAPAPEVVAEETPVVEEVKEEVAA